MADQTDRDLEDAEARGLERMERDPRAELARYDALTGRVMVDLVSGCTYAFPAKLVQNLHDATDSDLAEVTVDGMGFNLHWPRLDVDLYVPLLVAGVFGTKAWMARDTARGAERTMPLAKATAALSNSVNGRRPRKTASSL